MARAARSDSFLNLFGHHISPGMDFIMLLQGLISFGFLFLIGLALRNRFRI